MTIFTNISQTNSGGSDIDVEKIANTDLSNLTAVGETHFANKSLSNIDALGQAKFLNKQMITNCLISATSGLVTASGNTLTVPSGLIFLIPNGVDATTSMIKNIETITSVTTTFTESSSQYGTRVLFYNSDNTLTSYLQSEIEYDNVLKYWKANGSKIVAKNLATYYWDGSDISSFIPEQVATIEMSSMGAVLDTKANISFDNLTDSAKNIANWSSNVTNCITEIPQDIKLELNNGTLTLKAGSKVYVPNGANVFDAVTITNDLTITDTINRKLTLYTNASGTSLTRYATDSEVSGTTEPTGNNTFYNISLNTINRYNYGVKDSNLLSFPICHYTVSGGQITSIDQVFNGFGYIGSTLFALPGVKGLKTNGRNTDGSLRNEEFVLDSVKINNEFNLNANYYAIINGASNIINRSAKNITSYDAQNNYIYRSDGLFKVGCIAVELTATTNGITSFQPKTPFQAVDYSDTEFIGHQAIPSDRYINWTLLASGQTYTAPADGLIFLSKTVGTADSKIEMHNTTTDLRAFAPTGGLSTTSFAYCSIQVNKGDIVKIEYTVTGETNKFCFVYNNGSK